MPSLMRVHGSASLALLTPTTTVKTTTSAHTETPTATSAKTTTTGKLTFIEYQTPFHLSN